MLVDTVMIYVRRGKAYLPVVAQTETGVFVGVEPVYATALAPDDLVDALGKVLATGHPRLPHPTQEEWKRMSREDPVLRAAGVRNWREFSQHSVVYSIEWTDQDTTMYVLQLDHLGRAEYALAERMGFAENASPQAIVGAILKDVFSRPEVVEADTP